MLHYVLVVVFKIINYGYVIKKNEEVFCLVNRICEHQKKLCALKRRFLKEQDVCRILNNPCRKSKNSCGIMKSAAIFYKDSIFYATAFG